LEDLGVALNDVIGTLSGDQARMEPPVLVTKKLGLSPPEKAELHSGV